VSLGLGSAFDLLGGLGEGLTPHWLKMTPTLVTENFCLGGSASTPPPVPILQDQHNVHNNDNGEGYHITVC